MNKTTAILAAFIVLLLAAASFLGGYLTRKVLHPDQPPVTVTDTVWKWHTDTVILASSKPAGSVIVRVPVVVRDTVYKAGNDTIPPSFDNMLSQSDSATVEIPIEQRTYEGEYYRAIVQGWRPELVSMEVKLPEISVPKRKRWNVTIGPQVGYGFTPAGWQPYAGAGVTFGYTF